MPALAHGRNRMQCEIPHPSVFPMQIDTHVCVAIAQTPPSDEGATVLMQDPDLMYPWGELAPAHLVEKLLNVLGNLAPGSFLAHRTVPARQNMLHTWRSPGVAHFSTRAQPAHVRNLRLIAQGLRTWSSADGRCAGTCSLICAPRAHLD